MIELNIVVSTVNIDQVGKESLADMYNLSMIELNIVVWNVNIKQIQKGTLQACTFGP